MVLAVEKAAVIAYNIEGMEPNPSTEW